MTPESPLPQDAPARRARLQPQDIPWPLRLRVLAVWLASGVVATLLLVARLPLSGQVALEIGDVAPSDVVAPRQATFVSEILTQQRLTAAANGVPEVYDPPQARIGRQQLALANRIIDFLASVRSDSHADEALKRAYIGSLAGVDLSPEVEERILSLPQAGWDRVAAEIPAVLERAMREEIRENSLADERRKVAARVRLDLAEEDASVVTDIVRDLLVPNSFFNAERTEQRRQAARDAVEPVVTTVERSEVILRAGDIVTELDEEALKALGLWQTGWSWGEILSAGAFVAALWLVFLYYLWRVEPQLWFRWSEIILLLLVLLTFLFVAKAAIPGRTLMPYLMPYAALPLILSVVLGMPVALVTAGLFVLAVGWLSGGSLELMTLALCGGLAGTVKLRGGERLANFAWAAAFVTGANLLVVLAFRVAGGNWDWRGLLELSLATVGNGILTITVTLLGLYLAAAIFGVITPLQLLELSRPTHPLLRQLLLKAPGTYHHTLIVSNMAERAAEAIGADALLTRVGAYYHDVGKTIRPYFFVENRSDAPDPHARLDPVTSAQIIVTHVKDGLDLAKKHHLPRKIADFIPEHQGTLLVSFFYHQAVQAAGSADAVDRSQFQYPGPKPRSRETAITMLADGAEATVRSRHPANVEELEQIVAESFQNRMQSGQLDESPLTVADLATIRKTFVDVLRGLHHPRVAYPPQTPFPLTAAVPPTQEVTDASERTASPQPLTK